MDASVWFYCFRFSIIPLPSLSHCLIHFTSILCGKFEHQRQCFELWINPSIIVRLLQNIVRIILFSPPKWHIKFEMKWNGHIYVFDMISWIAVAVKCSLCLSPRQFGRALSEYFINIMNICIKLVSSVSLAYKYFHNTCIFMLLLLLLLRLFLPFVSIQNILIDSQVW